MKLPAILLLSALAITATAQQPPEIKRIPPPGIEVPAADRAEIETGLKQLAEKIKELKKNAALAGEIPNVEIFHKSADWAIRYNEIFDAKQIPIAKEHVQQGLARAAALAKVQAPWNTATGLVVRAYRSKIDGSVQPYGLLIPEGLKPGAKVPLHFWCHGRNEKLSELAFIDGSQKNKGEFTPEGAIVCFLYGRFCNANKFAGEVDLFEAFDDIKKHYAIDDQRLVMRGFSMGGAAAWQFGTHHSVMFAAVAPGAGFAETAEFFKVFAEGKEAPPWWEQVLWRWYDCTTMAANLANTTTVAYSGEIDGQKQAADIMLRYAEKEGITFPHIIGPQTPHKYHAESKVEINKIVDAAVAKGSPEAPQKVRFVTHSLIYPKCGWGEIQGMERQWERAEVAAERNKDGAISVTTKNVTRLRLSDDSAIPEAFTSQNGAVFRYIKMTPDGAQLPDRFTIDGAEFHHKGGMTALVVEKRDGKWMKAAFGWRDKKGDAAGSSGYITQQDFGVKRPGICGPIDHAFMDKFIFVRPTGRPINDMVGNWAKSEMERAIAQWRQVFRGEVTIVDDVNYLEQAATFRAVRAADILGAKKNDVSKDARKIADAFEDGPHIVLWGDISSNKVIAETARALPLKWTGTELSLALGTQKVDAAHHAPILIYPNPLNPNRYIVLNSGPTFREAAALNNSDQTPKLPDWAIVDLRTPPGPKWPGQIVDAGFFDETWK